VGRSVSAGALPLVVPVVARTEDLGELFPVHFETRIAWYGKYSRTRITGEIRNDSGRAADQLRLVIDGLNVKRHVITRVYRSVDATIPASGRASFEAEVRSAPSYRVYVDHLETPEAP
jgi:hypothetical protein